MTRTSDRYLGILPNLCSNDDMTTRQPPSIRKAILILVLAMSLISGKRPAHPASPAEAANSPRPCWYGEAFEADLSEHGAEARSTEPGDVLGDHLVKPRGGTRTRHRARRRLHNPLRRSRRSLQRPPPQTWRRPERRQAEPGS
jgi:hypothetical protein